MSIKQLHPGVFEIEEGNGDRTPKDNNIVKLKIGVNKTSGPLRKLVKDNFLGGDDLLRGDALLEEDQLETVSAAHDGSYFDPEGNLQHLPEVVFVFLNRMKTGQKVLIFENEDELDGKAHVVRLLEILELEIYAPKEARSSTNVEIQVTMNKSLASLDRVWACVTLLAGHEEDNPHVASHSKVFSKPAGDGSGSRFLFRIYTDGTGSFRVRVSFKRLSGLYGLEHLGHIDSDPIEFK